MQLKPNAQDIFTGVMLIAFSAIGLYLNLEHPAGTARRMGPGYMPMLTFWILIGFGLVVLITGLFSGPERIGTFSWRDIAVILAALLFFGATLERLGFFISIGGTILIAAIAEKKFMPLRVIGLVIGLLTICWLIFIYGLDIRIPQFPWSR